MANYSIVTGKPTNTNLRFVLTGFVLALFTNCASPDLQSISDQPNIILIMCDDLGWMDVGFNGNASIRTPNLDTLAAQGLKFNRFYAAAPVCSPTRASCLTGRSPFRMGIPNANAGHLPGEEITLPEILRDKNYFSGHFGKWHLGTLTRDTIDANRGGRRDQDVHYTVPSEHGYDVYFCTESKVPTHYPMIKPVE
ncbi:MAG: sulfatase-like hydrolase/transferase, partial [Saprospiraceae bacterium]|nr:sulfatase-like hydrolase/transferase [Saprospiraceae bacterium]